MTDTNLDEDEYDADLPDSDAEQSTSSAQQSTLDSIQLPGGRPLDTFEADELLRQFDAKIIAVVGERDSGKSTLISALLRQFKRSPFNNLLFAGSRTMLGFEEKAWNVHAASGNLQPTTARTSVEEGLHFLHLALASVDAPGQHIHLLLSDRAGETYRGARDVPSTGVSLPELGKSHLLVFILDGGRFADPLLRAEAEAAVRVFIRGLLDAGIIGMSNQIQVIVTKYDLIAARPDNEAILALDATEQGLSRLTEGRVAGFSLIRTAAQPDPGSTVEAGTGLAEMLSGWCGVERPRTDPPLAGMELSTEFDLLLTRWQRR